VSPVRCPAMNLLVAMATRDGIIVIRCVCGVCHVTSAAVFHLIILDYSHKQDLNAGVQRCVKLRISAAANFAIGVDECACARSF
jgi:hypothetical protein